LYSHFIFCNFKYIFFKKRIFKMRPNRPEVRPALLFIALICGVYGQIDQLLYYPFELTAQRIVLDVDILLNVQDTSSPAFIAALNDFNNSLDENVQFTTHGSPVFTGKEVVVSAVLSQKASFNFAVSMMTSTYVLEPLAATTNGGRHVVQTALGFYVPTYEKLVGDPTLFTETTHQLIRMQQGIFGGPITMVFANVSSLVLPFPAMPSK